MRFIIKHSQTRKPQHINKPVTSQTIVKKIEEPKPEFVEEKKVVDNNKHTEKPKKVMNTSKKIDMVEAIVNNNDTMNIKRIKKDKGLIERTESSKTIITEDNKQLLID